MKLRLYRNSVRLRLNQADVAAFVAEGRIRDKIDFGPGLCLSYGLEAASSVDRVQACYSPGCLRILLPSRLARAWTFSGLIGIASEGGSPTLLIEKDFCCLHREPGEEEDDRDTFPNPLAAQAEEVN